MEQSPNPIRPRRRWRSVAFMAVLTAGIALGSATTSVVWASHDFSDVPMSSPFHGDISWAADNGLVNGFPNGTYHPADPVSRQALAAILHRYNDELEIVHHGSSIDDQTFALNSVTCPAGKRPLSGGGTTTEGGMFLTDIAITATSVTVRWETDNNTVVDATLDAWALCAPA